MCTGSTSLRLPGMQWYSSSTPTRALSHNARSNMAQPEGLRNITERIRERLACRRATSSLYPGYVIVAKKLTSKSRPVARARERYGKGHRLLLEEEVHKV